MSFQTQSNSSFTGVSNTNQPQGPFGRYNNTWEEVFNINSPFSSFVTLCVDTIYGNEADCMSTQEFCDFVKKHELTVNWSVQKGIDNSHHCFVHGPWNTPLQQQTCKGPILDVPLNQCSTEFLQMVLSSIGYSISDSFTMAFLNYKADMQLLHGFQKRRWARYCIIRIRLPSFEQLTGRRSQVFNPIAQRRAQTSPSPQPVTNQKVPFDARTTTLTTKQDNNLPQFTVLREKPNSLFVKLNTHDTMPEVYECSAIYHRPLYLKFDSISNEFGYWIGRDSYIANNLI